MAKYKNSYGDYVFRDDAKTFSKEFYYINYLDANGVFDSDYSEQIESKKYAYNRASWLTENKWSFRHIHYKVHSIGLYSSLRGHIQSYIVL